MQIFGFCQSSTQRVSIAFWRGARAAIQRRETSADPVPAWLGARMVPRAKSDHGRAGSFIECLVGGDEGVDRAGACRVAKKHFNLHFISGSFKHLHQTVGMKPI